MVDAFAEGSFRRRQSCYGCNGTMPVTGLAKLIGEGNIVCLENRLSKNKLEFENLCYSESY